MCFYGDMKQFLNASEIARIEKVDKSTVSYWIKKGYFENISRVGEKGPYRIPLASYEVFRERRIRQVQTSPEDT